MSFFSQKAKRRRITLPTPAGEVDGEVQRLAAQADLILGELNAVVNQMSTMLREELDG
jgi:hypothetical protein